MNEDQEQVLLHLNRKVSQIEEMLEGLNGRLDRIEKDLARFVRIQPKNYPSYLGEGSVEAKGNDSSKNQVGEWLKRFPPHNPR